MTFRALYTQLFPPEPPLTEDNVSPQNGKIFIVTGGNSGVGLELCKILYATGATVYLTSRSEKRGMQAIKDITSSKPRNPGILKFILLDLNDLESVKHAASTFASQETRLHVLWNNAGTGAYGVSQGARTAQGLEAMIGIHCVATLLFTTLLIPHLRIAAAELSGSARVVWTSSVVTDQGSPTNGIDFETIDTGVPDRVNNYAVSKAGSWMLSREMARRYEAEGIISVAQNPGNVVGGSYEGTPAVNMWFLNRFILHPSIYGAYTELYAGLSLDVESGAYIIPWGRMRSDDECPRKDIIHALRPGSDGGLDYGKKLWDWCEQQWENVV
ncbi:short-chain dehydrogenase [Fusarium austroafricanum]|uniref:Short-chain dehydrogenase n=1 Tax=Fusarium austroafricanum TaxID=2364996 RepID=A0A8H4KHN2_9HYPO|nr:short-chain dehydrogenase [Fusarium austroafricanum]